MESTTNQAGTSADGPAGKNNSQKGGTASGVVETAKLKVSLSGVQTPEPSELLANRVTCQRRS